MILYIFNRIVILLNLKISKINFSEMNTQRNQNKRAQTRITGFSGDKTDSNYYNVANQTSFAVKIPATPPPLPTVLDPKTNQPIINQPSQYGVINFEEYLRYKQLRNQRIIIFLVTFWFILFLIGAGTCITIFALSKIF